MIILVFFVLLVFAYTLLSNLIKKRNFSAPMIFTIGGIAIVLLLIEFNFADVELEFFLLIAEMGLVFLLFTDGIHIKLLMRDGLRSLHGRLLTTGMLLTIALGLLVALVLFDTLAFWEAAILAAILAPTDAGLGHAIVSDKRIPERIRQSLNVEAGLNDGLAVPFLLFFIGMAASNHGGGEVSLTRYFIEQFGYGVAIGFVVGRGGRFLFDNAMSRGWIGSEYSQLGFAALPVLCIILAEETHASMFIAAFVAGLAANRDNDHGVGSHSAEFIENWGQLINLTIFFLFGILVAQQWQDLEPIHFLYGVLSLTVIRMVPVAISMIGAGLKPTTVLFMGWFGPRGLASIVLGLVFLEHSAENFGPALETISLTLIATVLMSIFAHGITAGPGARIYASKVKALADDAPEKVTVE